MPSKTTKKARRASTPKGERGGTRIEDDGKRYRLVLADTKQPVYVGNGMRREVAEEMQATLLAPALIEEIV